VGNGLGFWRRVAFQHLLDEVYTAARRVVFVMQQHIGRATGCAEAVVLARLEDLVGLGNMNVGQLGWREVGLHVVP